MHDVDGWPQEVRAHMRRTYGEPSGADRLGGMSLGRVYRVRFPDGSVIVKTSSRPSEALFYETVAGRLREAGIPIPEMEWSCHLPGSHWLILESTCACGARSVINVASVDRVLSKSCRWLAVVCLRAIEHLALEKGHELTGASDGPFGLRLAHARLLVVGDVGQVHDALKAECGAALQTFCLRMASARIS